MNLIRDIRIYKIVLLVAFLLLILVDSALLILFLNDYLLFFLTRNIASIFIFVHLFLMFLLLLSYSWTRASLVITIPIGIFVGLGLYLYAHYALYPWSYQDLDSPQHTQSLVLRYRVATLGESHYFFEVYQRSAGQMLIQHLTTRDFNFVLQHDEKYRGIQNVRWVNESTIQFDVQGVSKKLSLK